MVEIFDEEVLAKSGERFHPIVRFTGQATDDVSGTLFELSSSELALADSYEVDDYQRLAVRLESGAEAWVYVGRGSGPPDE